MAITEPGIIVVREKTFYREEKKIVEKRIGDYISGEITTLDATPTILATFAFQAFENGLFEVVVQGRDALTSDLYWYRAQVAIACDGYESYTFGAPEIIFERKDIDASSWTITFTHSDLDFQIQVTGEVGKEINWIAFGRAALITLES